MSENVKEIMLKARVSKTFYERFLKYKEGNALLKESTLSEAIRYLLTLAIDMEEDKIGGGGNNPDDNSEDIKRRQAKLFVQPDFIPPPVEGEAAKGKEEMSAEGRIRTSCPHWRIIELYHKICPMLSKVIYWNQQRQSYLRQRWREDVQRQNLEWWEGFFKKVAESDFLCGRSTCDFTATLEWLIRPRNFVKVLEGNYDNKRNKFMVGASGETIVFKDVDEKNYWEPILWPDGMKGKNFHQKEFSAAKRGLIKPRTEPYPENYTINHDPEAKKRFLESYEFTKDMPTLEQARESAAKEKKLDG